MVQEFPIIKEVMSMRTKKEAQQELWEKFGIRNTADFKGALKHGQIDEMEEVLKHIAADPAGFPQYDQAWLHDRRAEIKVARLRLEKGEKAIEPKRSAETAKAELKRIFGFADTTGFRAALERGEIENAKAWLNHIATDPGNFPQYLDTWDEWKQDREDDIRKAEQKNNFG
jgi:hypothetical protein